MAWAVVVLSLAQEADNTKSYAASRFYTPDAIGMGLLCNPQIPTEVP